MSVIYEPCQENPMYIYETEDDIRIRFYMSFEKTIGRASRRNTEKTICHHREVKHSTQ